MNNAKYCPYRTKSVVYHNKMKNHLLPDYGLNSICDHDIIDTKFQICIQDECMAYNKHSNTCMYIKKK